jgi:HPt (histidine-containing phosphotransfer) domain-containing protein
MFMENGFDGFIAKPIDLRELNATLNHLIRNKQPPDVIEAVRKEEERSETPYHALDSDKPNPIIFKAFVEDAQSAIALLEKTLPVISQTNEDGIRMYTTTVHGLKSALANIGEKALSDTAFRLEEAGHDSDIATILAETPAFLRELNELVQRVKPAEIVFAEQVSDENLIYLRDKLTVIKNACAIFDKGTAKITLQEVRRLTWPQKVSEALDGISTHLLHGIFKRASAVASELIEWLDKNY